MRLSVSQLDWAYAMVAVYNKLLRNDEESAINPDGIHQYEETKGEKKEGKQKGAKHKKHPKQKPGPGK